MISAGKVFKVLVLVIIFENPIKNFLGQQFDELCKDISSSVLIVLGLKFKQYMKSNQMQMLNY